MIIGVCHMVYYNFGNMDRSLCTIASRVLTYHVIDELTYGTAKHDVQQA